MTTLATYDLTPAPRRAARLHRRRLAMRARLVAAAALIVAAAHAVTYFTIAPTPKPLQASLDHELKRRAAIATETAETSAALNQAVIGRELIDEIGTQPNWAHLLALLATTTDRRISFTELTLELLGPQDKPLKADLATPRDTARGPFRLILRGEATAPGVVASLGLRLEQIAVFEAVNVLETARTGDGGLALFTIECRLGSPPPPPQTPDKPTPR